MNMSGYLRRPLHVLVLMAVLISGCTEEKALALKNAAIQYRDQSARGLKLSVDGVRSSLAMPAVSQQKLAENLQSELFPINAQKLAFLMTADKPLATAADAAVKPMVELQEKIAALSAAFDNLPQGSYLSADQVKQTLPIAIRLNQSLLNIAQMAENGTLRLTNNVRRIDIIERHRDALALPAGAARSANMDRLAKDVMELSANERQLQIDAQVALLQAAELGNSLIGLAKDYDKISIKDILSGLKDALNLAAKISPESGSVTQALTRLQSSTKAWQDDPVLAALLTQQISK
jgi:hypothetical protein